MVVAQVNHTQATENAERTLANDTYGGVESYTFSAGAALVLNTADEEEVIGFSGNTAIGNSGIEVCWGDCPESAEYMFATETAAINFLESVNLVEYFYPLIDGASWSYDNGITTTASVSGNNLTFDNAVNIDFSTELFVGVADIVADPNNDPFSITNNHRLPFDVEIGFDDPTFLYVHKAEQYTVPAGTYDDVISCSS